MDTLVGGKLYQITSSSRVKSPRVKRCLEIEGGNRHPNLLNTFEHFHLRKNMFKRQKKHTTTTMVAFRSFLLSIKLLPKFSQFVLQFRTTNGWKYPRKEKVRNIYMHYVTTFNSNGFGGVPAVTLW